MPKVESSETDETGSTPIVTNKIKAKSPSKEYLNSARRVLKEDELTSPGAIRLLISDIDRLEERCTQLEDIEEEYNELRVKNAVLESRSKSSRWNEVLSALCLAVGSFGLAQGQRLLGIDAQHDVGIATICVSTLLVLAGIASKVWK